MSGEANEIPLFPLHTVLFPGGPLTLRLFEPRYLDMVSRCLRDDSGFGVALIRQGGEVGEAAETHNIGMLVRITYWERRPDKLLGITVRGERRFRILSTRVMPDQLVMAEVSWLPAAESAPVPSRFAPLAELLHGIIDQLDHPYITLPRHFDDAAWVAGRLAEILPLALSRKQRLLESDDSYWRLSEIQNAIASGAS
ncbi:LON peptidase substrate-binding domain-containing protein [Thiohalomonas denitrificans]|uniref:Lon N-terminal domain-containing protein n=1 Tax=Thiohalomonas denitrificans TaxID=415747 RepID=A0A1G5Q8Q5_9GAMM|nr:LON peptidase substrate-binding domain-containing protein [Thiohalomonas denitrificans]SCZ57639.1 hypothetical protein SAMN03097708_01472 [Thiohalomonas denitrificans]